MRVPINTKTDGPLHQKIFTVGGSLLPRSTEATPNKATEAKLFEAKLLVDNSLPMSDLDIYKILQNEVPNLPAVYWQTLNNNFPAMNNTCAKFPSLVNLRFNNVYWQTMETSNGSFYLYGAYYDNRTLEEKAPVVRILGMINRLEPQVKTTCQLWFKSYKVPVFATVHEYKYVWRKQWGNPKNGQLQPYLMSCQIPIEYRHLVPESVSLVENPCDMAVINLRVINNVPEHGEKKEFAVCVKGLDYLHADLSVRLVEWLETLHYLGADKIFLYELEVHPNISKVLNYYKQRGLVDVTPITLPAYQPNIKRLLHIYFKMKVLNQWQNELIPYNDCLYKNMHMYKYITLLDIDEVIMPKGDNILWKDLIDNISKKVPKGKNLELASYIFRNVHYFSNPCNDEISNSQFIDIPPYMYMFQHIYRARNYSLPGYAIKSFHNTDRVLTLHNHFPLACIGGACSFYNVVTEDAQLQHYRPPSQEKSQKWCDNYTNFTVLDDAIWRHKDPIIPRVNEALRYLGFFS
ncbi:uncharacterized protein LOC125179322 [Hyalella azteca]|uniref:Glycosyltransferase family 92 protein n=1 Tax=Hyalella azteca TaxID=294128 RepID=A0A979FWM3_HYAAZ|nr:uncharacterized protein LOC125179322 [Hyalella azteca]